MKSSLQYRWSITTENVYSFCGLHAASTIASYKNEVSGFVKKENVAGLIAALVPYGGREFLKLRLVTAKTYWKNYDTYNS